jgi:glycerol-3-phosphate cytidylyltransferase
MTARDSRPAAPAVIGYAPGVYDLFHVGHLNLLRRARLACDWLVAGVVSDVVAEGMKHRMPVVPEDERMEIVEACRFVDEVFLEDQPDKYLTWERVGYTALFKGDDWVLSPTYRDLMERLAPQGVQLIYLPYTAHLSSTILRDQDGVDEGHPERRRTS